MTSVQNVQERITALEEALRQTAFEVLKDSRSYEQATKLLRLAESLKELESEFAKIMHPTASDDDDQKCKWWGRAYPRFCIRNNRLVKEGKGKKSVVPYTQEVDRGGFDVVVRWIAQHNQEPWQMSEMVESLSDEVAGYKPYVVAGALSEAELLRKVKRGSYRAAHEVSAEDWWNRLADGPGGEAEAEDPGADEAYSPIDDDEIPF